MDYDVALRLEVTESQSNKQYHCKTLSGYSQSLTPRTLVPLAPVLFYIDFWDKNYICIKKALFHEVEDMKSWISKIILICEDNYRR